MCMKQCMDMDEARIAETERSGAPFSLLTPLGSRCEGMYVCNVSR